MPWKLTGLYTLTPSCQGCGHQLRPQLSSPISSSHPTRAVTQRWPFPSGSHPG